jgi:cell division protein FtsB
VKKGRRAAALERSLLWVLAIGQRGIVIVLAIAVLVAFAAGTVEQRWKEQRLRDQVNAQQVTLQEAEARNAQLRSQLAESDPAAYRAWVEATARRQLNLGYSGETVFLVNWHESAAPAASVMPTTAPQAAVTPPPAEAHWHKWLRMLTGE